MLSIVQQLEAVYAPPNKPRSFETKRKFRGLANDVLRVMGDGHAWDSGRLARTLDRKINTVSTLLLRLCEIDVVTKVGAQRLEHGGRDKWLYVLNKDAL